MVLSLILSMILSNMRVRNVYILDLSFGLRTLNLMGLNLTILLKFRAVQKILVIR